MNNKRKNIYILIALFVIAFIIRILHITVNPISNDEPFTIFYSQQNLNELFKLFNHENNPPLHFILLHFWMKMFGASAFSIRLLSTLFGALTVVPIFKIGNEFFSRKVGIITSLMFVFSNIHIMESHDARVYSILVFWVVLSYYFFLKILKNEHSIWIKIGYMLTLILMLYSHYISVFVLTSQFLTVAFVKQERWIKLKTIFFLQLVSVIAFLPFLKVFIFRVNQTTQNESWVPKPTLDSLFIVLRQFFNQPIVAVLAIVSMVGVFMMIIFKRITLKEKPVLAILMWFFIPYFLVFLLSFYSSQFLAKYLIFASIGGYFIVAIFWTNIAVNIKFKEVILAIPVFLMLFTSNPAISSDRRPDLMVKRVKNIQTPKTIIIVSPNWEKLVFCYHYNIEYFNDYQNMEKRLNADNIYFVYMLEDTIVEKTKNFNRIILVDTRDNLMQNKNTETKLSNDFFRTDKFEVYPYKIYTWERK